MAKKELVHKRMVYMNKETARLIKQVPEGQVSKIFRNAIKEYVGVLPNTEETINRRFEEKKAIKEQSDKDFKKIEELKIAKEKEIEINLEEAYDFFEEMCFDRFDITDIKEIEELFDKFQSREDKKQLPFQFLTITLKGGNEIQ